MHGHELRLVNLASAVDQHWSGKLPGIGGRGDVQSFRGLYAVLYRNYSGLPHPTYRGLNHVVEDLGVGRRRVRLEPAYDGSGPYGIATMIWCSSQAGTSAASASSAFARSGTARRIVRSRLAAATTTTTTGMRAGDFRSPFPTGFAQGFGEDARRRRPAARA
jgi:hypothetical protein